MGDTPRRALLMSSGANRGAYYAGFPQPWLDGGVEFELMCGVSAGGIAAAWFAARQWQDIVASWREACTWRIAPHPVLRSGRRRTVDELIQRITLRIMKVEEARTSPVEVRLAASRVVEWPALGLPRAELRLFSNRKARDRTEFALMLRATGFVPLMNGLRSSIEIDGQRFVDGGLVTRVPFELVPEGRFDELWLAVCSPHGLAELAQRLSEWRRAERLVVVTPSYPLPVNRWTLDWPRIRDTIEIGRRDMEIAIVTARAGSDHVFVGRHADRYRRSVKG